MEAHYNITTGEARINEYFSLVWRTERNRKSIEQNEIIFAKDMEIIMENESSLQVGQNRYTTCTSCSISFYSWNQSYSIKHFVSRFYTRLTMYLN